MCVCVLGKQMSLAKTAEPIEMPFAGQTQVAQKTTEVYLGAT